MLDTFFGFKLGQEQAFDGEGRSLVATKVLAQPLEIKRIKDKKRDGYKAIVVNIKYQISPASPSACRGRANIKKKKKELLREIKVEEPEKFKPGDSLTVNQVFKPGDKVIVTGRTKGKGFAGVVKRWGFAGGPKTHGQSDRERAPGSIGQRTDPGRVWKGKKMAGRMGGKTKTIKGLKVFKIGEEKGELWLQGLVPGARRGLVKISKIKN